MFITTICFLFWSNYYGSKNKSISNEKENFWIRKIELFEIFKHPKI